MSRVKNEGNGLMKKFQAVEGKSYARESVKVEGRHRTSVIYYPRFSIIKFISVINSKFMFKILFWIFF